MTLNNNNQKQNQNPITPETVKNKKPFFRRLWNWIKKSKQKTRSLVRKYYLEAKAMWKFMRSEYYLSYQLSKIVFVTSILAWGILQIDMAQLRHDYPFHFQKGKNVVWELIKLFCWIAFTRAMAKFEAFIFKVILWKNWIVSTYTSVSQALFSFPTEFEKWWQKTSVLLNSVTDQVLICSLLKIVCILIAVAYFTIAERKVMAAIQRRKGPNVVGFWGLLQPLADGAKLIFKEVLIPTRANNIIFLIAPIMVLVLSMISWSLIPTGLVVASTTPLINQLSFEMNPLTKSPGWQGSNTVDIEYGILFLLAVSGLNVYGIIIAGWASNSKYAFLGALRSAAQMISYEVSLSLLILPVVLLAGSLNLTEIVAAQERTGWFCFPLLPCTVMFFISMLAETNRAPFDLPEAWSELVAGYNVEYSSIIFAMFFLGEYSNMLLMATVMVLFFFGGWLSPISFLNWIPGSLFFSLKIVIFCFFFILVRAAFPRYRYDQLMQIGWKTFLPLSLSYLVFVAGFLVAFDAAPQVLEIEPPIYSENVLFY